MAILVDENKLRGLLGSMYWLGVKNQTTLSKGKNDFQETYDEAIERIIGESKKSP